MLYPYSDNFLDDPSIANADKIAFQGKFRRWLSGFHSPGPSSPGEKKVSDQVMTIEQGFDRVKNINAYNSLVAILDGQTASLKQHTKPGEPVPTLETLLNISVFKGLIGAAT